MKEDDMAPGPSERLILPEDDQFRLGYNLYQRGYFGIYEDKNRFTPLKSGRESPHYLDMRRGISSYLFRSNVATALLKMTELRSIQKGAVSFKDLYDHLAGTPQAMPNYVTTMADMAAMSLVQPRVDQGKKSGNTTAVLGEFKDGDKVAVYDDVVAGGDAKIETIATLRLSGLVVEDYFVVLDREEGGAPYVKELLSTDITAALSLSSLVRLLRAERSISQQQYDNVARYLDQYGEPHAQTAMNSPL